MCCKKYIAKTRFCIAKIQKLSHQRQAAPCSSRIVKLRCTFYLLIRTLYFNQILGKRESQTQHVLILRFCGFETFHRYKTWKSWNLILTQLNNFTVNGPGTWTKGVRVRNIQVRMLYHGCKDSQLCWFFLSSYSIMVCVDKQ